MTEEGAERPCECHFGGTQIFIEDSKVYGPVWACQKCTAITRVDSDGTEEIINPPEKREAV